jgi:HEAT repeat protein
MGLPLTCRSLNRRVATLRLVVFGAVALAAGCEVTPDKIARWKETERGPKKLREALGNDSVSPALRGQALAALVELGMTSEALTELDQAPDAARQNIVHGALPALGALLGPPGSPAPTTRPQREAKDALFTLRKNAAAADRAQIDDLLIAWTTADLGGRMSQGGNSSEKILLAIGPRATPRLMQLLVANSPQTVTAASLVGRLGDDATRAHAADQLVAAIRKSPSVAQAEPLYQALGLVGGPRATAFLVDAAEHGSDRGREKALLALGQGRLDPHDQAALAGALRLAGDKKVPGEVREAAFQVAEKIGPEAVPGLIKLMADPDDTVRWRAVEAALAAGKDKAVQPVLEAISPGRPYKKEDLDSYVVHDLGLIGPAALAPLKDELKSKSWVAKVVAVRGLSAMGKAEDAPVLEPLLTDATPLKGWPGTIGTEAKGALAALRAKR